MELFRLRWLHEGIRLYVDGNQKFRRVAQLHISSKSCSIVPSVEGFQNRSLSDAHPKDHYRIQSNYRVLQASRSNLAYWFSAVHSWTFVNTAVAMNMQMGRRPRILLFLLLLLFSSTHLWGIESFSLPLRLEGVKNNLGWCGKKQAGRELGHYRGWGEESGFSIWREYFDTE